MNEILALGEEMRNKDVISASKMAAFGEVLSETQLRKELTSLNA